MFNHYWNGMNYTNSSNIVITPFFQIKMGKLILGTLALVFSASISEGGKFSESKYFDNKLDSIQGAIDDTIKAGLDLKLMEGSLENIVAASSYFFRTESATEYAVDAEAYINGWIATG